MARDGAGWRRRQVRPTLRADMATLTDLVVQLVGSAVDLVGIFVTQVALRDPLTFLVFLAGAAITTVAAGGFGLLAAGGVVGALRNR